MTTRDQLIIERQQALIDILAEEGIIQSDWRDALREMEERGDGEEISQSARDGSGPPTL